MEPRTSHQKWTTGITISLAICWIICGFLAVFFDDDWLTTTASLVTVIGLPIAIAFFWLSDKKANQLLTAVTGLDGKELKSEDAASGDEETAPEGTAPVSLSPNQEMPGEGHDNCINLDEYWVANWDGVEIRTYRTYETPIRIIGDLYVRWIEEGKQGRYLFDRLDWIARRPGKGNNPWYIKFKDEDSMYRVSYGGKRGATVSNHPLPVELEDRNWTKRTHAEDLRTKQGR